jgi:DDE superfamily endonuclease
VIERAYRLAEALGLPLWCQDEAGPSQAIPQPGPSWQPVGTPAHRPHEYVRGGTAKLLTLFRPATGEVRAAPVESAPNAVLHPWLQQELTAILAEEPRPPAEPGPGRRWAVGARCATAWDLDARRPPLRALLIWDNLAGHKSVAMERWLLDHGILPLFTPIAGSWLNLAESVQRILVRRALAGQHPQSAQQVMDWLADTVLGWNVDPTPFVWAGKRAERRRHAREHHRLGGSLGYSHRPIARCRHKAAYGPNGHQHDN